MAGSRAVGYRETLQRLADWEPYLLAESGLPGPRANLELAKAAAEQGNEAVFRKLLAYSSKRTPANSPEEFLAFCGVVGLGKLLAEGKLRVLKKLRKLASDPRWRIREAVALALQYWGASDMLALLQEMKGWSQGSRLEQRAAVAALCEPALLRRKAYAHKVLQILDRVTSSLVEAGDRKSVEFEVLRKSLGYGWSVAVAALPDEGKPRMERWSGHEDPDVRWVMLENLNKHRLAKMDPRWVARAQKQMASRTEPLRRVGA